ncbi:ABC transporter ATP-binding protein [Colidextribacter sp. OB.20]|uniref:ABC transporter ATP-binding protein n=1 Tax=Colidextribacter sp. OB.20 TaxID=2304568 RepID=UPI00136D6B03|nr:ABC transporter ATP-binding protein [Colidextribacter sp. OB.20]NBI08672.1 ABC transporter ATP-binding protein [Colidextribacter sp. OB.20]
MSEILKVAGLEKVYGRGGAVTRALDGVSLSLEAGEFVGVMGPSGSGKTTLLNCVSTIDRPSSGSIVIDGRELTRLKGRELAKFRRERLGFIFQDCNLLDTLTAFENIALALSIVKAPAQRIDKRVREMAELLGISDCLNKYPYQMSGGQQQRCAAARAMVTRPALVLADEPTGALDSKSSQLLLDRLEELNRELGATILMVTHDAFTASCCRRVVFLQDGKLFLELHRERGSRRDFFQKIIQVTARMGGGMADVL